METISADQFSKRYGDLAAGQFKVGDTVSGDVFDKKYGQASLQHSQTTLDKYNAETAQAKIESQKANSPVGLAKETGKGIIKQGINFIGSAIRSPKDLLGGLMGKTPDQTPLPITGDKTIQAKAADNTAKVFDQQMTPVQATTQAVGDTVGGAADVVGGEGLLKGGMNLIKKPLSKLTDFLGARSTKKATEAIQSTAETMTKSERKQAIAEGRLESTLTGSKYVPSKTEEQAGKLLAGKVKSNPIKNVPIIQNEIKTLGQGAEDYLAKNTKNITNEEHAKMFSTKRDEMAKYSTDSEMKAYDEQVGIFSRQLPGRGGFNTPNYYKSLKDYEENVTSRLPKGREALLSETGSAKLQAAKDVRSVVRDMLGEKHPEFKPKMFDLASMYDALDNAIVKAEQVGGIKKITQFAKKHPVVTGIGVLEANKISKDTTGIGFSNPF